MPFKSLTHVPLNYAKILNLLGSLNQKYARSKFFLFNQNLTLDSSILRTLFDSSSFISLLQKSKRIKKKMLIYLKTISWSDHFFWTLITIIIIWDTAWISSTQVQTLIAMIWQKGSATCKIGSWSRMKENLITQKRPVQGKTLRHNKAEAVLGAEGISAAMQCAALQGMLVFNKKMYKANLKSTDNKS